MFKFILLSLLSSWHCYAFNYGETLQAPILKPGRQAIVIERGLEDGLKRGDHIRLKDSKGYVARAIVMRTLQKSSLIIPYNSYKNPKLEEESTLEIKRLPKKLIPERIKRSLSSLP